MEYNPFHDPSLVRKLLELKLHDNDKYMDLVYTSIESWPALVMQDPTEVDAKLSALQKIRMHYEEKEQYERCAVISEIELKLIKQNEEGQVRGDE